METSVHAVECCSSTVELSIIVGTAHFGRVKKGPAADPCVAIAPRSTSLATRPIACLGEYATFFGQTRP